MRHRSHTQNKASLESHPLKLIVTADADVFVMPPKWHEFEKNHFPTNSLSDILDILGSLETFDN